MAQHSLQKPPREPQAGQHSPNTASKQTNIGIRSRQESPKVPIIDPARLPNGSTSPSKTAMRAPNCPKWLQHSLQKPPVEPQAAQHSPNTASKRTNIGIRSRQESLKVPNIVPTWLPNGPTSPSKTAMRAPSCPKWLQHRLQMANTAFRSHQ